MNLESTISIWAGGPGSGCHGDNCGRKPTSMGNLDKERVKGLGTIPDDPAGGVTDRFWVMPNGDVYRESAMLGPGFHEHWDHAYALMKADPKKFAVIKQAYDKAMDSVKNDKYPMPKYQFVDNLVNSGAIRTFVEMGKGRWNAAGIQVDKLSDKILSRIQALVDGFPTERFSVDWWDKKGARNAEGSAKEVMGVLRKSFRDDNES